MKILKTTLNSLLILMVMLFAQFAFGQKISAKSVSVSVSGTSPMHDWTMSATGGAFAGTVSGNAISNVKFSIPAKNLKSTKGKMMDNKAYEALKASSAPTIYFAASSIAVGKSSVSGKLAIAGVTKTVSIPVTVAKKGSGYVIEGTESIKMSDFGMSRPGFMGVKTGDAVTVKVVIVAE